MTKQSTFTTLLCLAFLSLVHGRDCYFPDHSLAENFTACNAAIAESACCHTDSACLSNSLCLTQTGYANRITRGACTDQTFDDAACPQVCSEVETNRSTSFFPANISPSPSPNGMFCCVGSYNSTSRQCQYESNSAGSLQPFELDEGTVIIDRNTGATLSDSSTTNSSSGGVVTVTAKSDSTIVSVGAGVGVSLGVLLIAALIGCAMLYSQLRKAKKQLHSVETKGNYQDHHETSVLTSSNGHQSSYGGSMHKPYSYSADRSPPPAPTESPFNSVLVEAPTEREVAMADSRPLQKP